MTKPLPTATEPLTRRHLLRNSLALGAATFAGPVLRVASASAATSKTVRVLTWQGYADPAAYGPLLKRGVKIDPIAMNDDNVDPINKAGQYDIGTTTVGIFPNFIEAGIAQPLDLSRIPNFAHHLKSATLYSSRVGPPAPEVSKQGKAYGVPFAWGTLGVSYRVGKGPGVPSRLDDLLHPAYAGKLGLVSDPINVIQAVARSLGLGGTDLIGNHPAPLFLTSAELETVFKKLGKFKAHARTIYPTYGALVTAYARGEIIAALPDWAPDAVAATKGGITVNVTFPPDCSQSYVDSFFISSKVTPTAEMYEFLNQALSPTTQYAVGKSLGIAVTNGQAFARLVTQGPSWSVYKNVQSVLRSAPYVLNPPISSSKYVTTGQMLTRWEHFTA